MTRKRIAGALAATAMLAAPALASAHDGRDDHGRHHGHHHHHHHAKKAPVRSVAGTVTSFAGGQLTITLVNGKSYDGQVTRRTILHCRSALPVPVAAPRAARHGHGHGPGDHGSAPSTTAPSTTAPSTTAPSTTLPPTTRAGGCSVADLVAGAKVTAAKLTLTGDGATWKKVDLLK